MFLDLSYKGCRVHYLIIEQNYFVLGEGRPYLKASANSNVYSTCVPFNKKKKPSSLSSVKFSCLISYYLHSVP